MPMSNDDLLLKIARRHNTRETVRIKRCPLVFDHKNVNDERSITAVANTASIDLDNEVVVPEGADTGYFFKNRTIFWNHDYNQPVATLRSANLKGGKWLCNMVFGKTPFATEAAQMVADGVVTGTSVGFIPVDYGRPTPDEAKSYGPQCESVVRTWRWLELSITPLPCNADAVIRQEAAKRLRPETCKMILSELRPRKRVLLFVDSPE